MQRKTLFVYELKKQQDTPLFHLILKGWPQRFIPGQFVMLRPRAWEFDPLWPRPFSICTWEGDLLHLFIQVVGRGTARLSALTKGDAVECWGPLGNGFPEVSKPLLILSGGMGIAPFISLLRTKTNQPVRLIFGHRLDLSCYPWEMIPDHVDKRSFCQQSEQDLKEFELRLRDEIWQFKDKGLIFACGPRPFLEVVHKYGLESQAKVYLSLENKMACGIGACLGCVAKTKTGFVQTCTHGPVFEAATLEEF